MVKLFCMPWAGGASYCYNFWNSTDEIEVIPIEYSGHGKRFGEKLSYEFTDLIHDCLMQIVSGEEDDVCLFGHSMGALAAFECAHALSAGNRKPKHLFVSGMCAPDCWEKNCTPVKEDKDIVEHIKRLDGIPQELLENHQILDIFVPMIKADYLALGTYRYSHPRPLSLPVTVFSGTLDEQMYKDRKGWTRETGEACTFYEYQGGHFFIKDSFEDIMNRIISQLKGKKRLEPDERICY